MNGEPSAQEADGDRGRKWVGRRIRAEFIVGRPFLWLWRLLPECLSPRLGQVVGTLLYLLLAKRRRIGHTNLQLAFPELPPSAHRRILRRSYRNLGRTIAEILRLPAFTDTEIRKRVAYSEGSLENLLEAERLGKGVILFTAHLGNWELLALAHSLRHRPMHIVARPLTNRMLNRDLRRLRCRGGNTICERRNLPEMRRLMRHLEAGGTVGLLVDQCPRHGGVAVPFFDVPALSHTGPAVLALKTGAALVPVFIRRDGNGAGRRHVIHFAPRLRFDGLRGDPTSIVEVSACLQRLVEAEIRSRPEDWLWMHRRWKGMSTMTYPVGGRRRRRKARLSGTARPRYAVWLRRERLWSSRRARNA